MGISLVFVELFYYNLITVQKSIKLRQVQHDLRKHLHIKTSLQDHIDSVNLLEFGSAVVSF